MLDGLQNRLIAPALTPVQVDELAGELQKFQLTEAEWAEWAVAISTARERAVQREQAAAAAQAEDARIEALVRRLAHVHVAEWQRYEGLCQAWAERETARLWQPWAAWRVRYAPDFQGMAALALVASDEGAEAVGAVAEALIQEVVAQPVLLADLESPFNPRSERSEEDLDALDRFHSGMHLTTVLRGAGSGATGRLVIGAFVDATPIIWELPEVNEGLAYHQTYWAGTWAVNVPALVAEKPEAGPRPTDGWRTRLTQALAGAEASGWRLKDRLRDWDAEEWAQAGEAA